MGKGEQLTPPSPALSRADVALSSPLRLLITRCQKEKKYRTSCGSLTSTFITLRKENKSPHHANNICLRLSLFKKTSVVKKRPDCAEGNRGFQRFSGSRSWSPVERSRIALLFHYSEIVPPPRRRNWSTEQEEAWPRVSKWDVGSFSTVEGRHLLWAEWSVLVWVIQLISFSNLPTAGAVPPVFPSVSQQSFSSRGPVCKVQLLSPSPPSEPLPTPSLCPNQSEQRACWKYSQTLHPLCLRKTLGILPYQGRQCSSGERKGRKGGHMPVAQAQLQE